MLRSLFCIVLIPLCLVLSSCAPKRVSVYDVGSGVRGDIVNTALGLIGKQYRNGAKGPDAFDCSGLVHYVYTRNGIGVPISTDGLVRSGYRIYSYNVLPGDLVFFEIKKDYHVGIMVNRLEFIHASKSRGVTIGSLGSDYWKKRVKEFRNLL